MATFTWAEKIPPFTNMLIEGMLIDANKVLALQMGLSRLLTDPDDRMEIWSDNERNQDETRIIVQKMIVANNLPKEIMSRIQFFIANYDDIVYQSINISNGVLIINGILEILKIDQNPTLKTTKFEFMDKLILDANKRSISVITVFFQYHLDDGTLSIAWALRSPKILIRLTRYFTNLVDYISMFFNDYVATCILSEKGLCDYKDCDCDLRLYNPGGSSVRHKFTKPISIGKIRKAPPLIDSSEIHSTMSGKFIITEKGIVEKDDKEKE